MNNSAYWKIRHWLTKLSFQAKKLVFILLEKGQKASGMFSWHVDVWKTIIVEVLKGLLGVSVVLKADKWILSATKEMAICGELFLDIILGGMGIAGVILGLYCANLSSIFSAKYTNAPRSLADAFQRDSLINGCVRQIILFIVVCVLLLLAVLSNTQIYWVTVLSLLFLIIRLVVTFSKTGNRSYILSDTFRLADQAYIQIGQMIKRVSKGDMFSKNVSFQNHFAKVSGHALTMLMEIANYNITIPKTQNSAMVSFMTSNLKILLYYWMNKASIPYDSYWFPVKNTYKQWHYASDKEVWNSIQTGHPISAEAKHNPLWFEDKILSVNDLGIEKLIKDGDTLLVRNYILSMADLSAQAYNANILDYWITRIAKYQKSVEQYMNRVSADDMRKQEDAFASLVDTICIAYISMSIGIWKYIQSLDWDKLFARIKKCKNFSDCKAVSSVFNNEKCEQLFRHIQAELSIEHERVTPDWYLEQVIAYSIYRKLGDAVDALKRIVAQIFGLGKLLMDQQQPYIASVVFSQYFSLKAETDRILTNLEVLLPKLEQKRKEDSIVWEYIALSALKDEFQAEDLQVHAYLVKCCGSFALKHWDNREDFPDFLGFCYNRLCESLISSIEHSDFTAFKTVYKDFLPLSLQYFEYVRTSVIQNKTPCEQNDVFHTATAPLVEFAMISGFAILWGEFVEDLEWRKTVDNEIKRYVSEKPLENIQILYDITKRVQTRRNISMRIRKRDIIQMVWEGRIAQAIMGCDKFRIVYRSPFRPELDTNSKLLRAFIDLFGSPYIYLHNVEDIFFIISVNPYLEDDYKYKSSSGWEAKLHENEE